MSDPKPGDVIYPWCPVCEERWPASSDPAQTYGRDPVFQCSNQHQFSAVERRGLWYIKEVLDPGR